jgi:integrase
MSENRITVWVQQRKDRSLLALEWIDPDTGRRRSKSAGTADPKKAEQRRGDLEADRNSGRYQEASRLAWDRFRQLFQDEYLAGLRQRTREKYNTVLDVFEDVVNPDRLRSVTERTVSAFVRGLRERKRPQGKVGLAPMSIRNYLISLKTALSWAVGQKLLPSLPKFPTVHVPKKKPQPVPAESFERLLAKAPDDLWRAYLLCG